MAIFLVNKRSPPFAPGAAESSTLALARGLSKTHRVVVVTSNCGARRFGDASDVRPRRVQRAWNGVDSAMRPRPRDDGLPVRWHVPDLRPLLLLDSLIPREYSSTLVHAARFVREECCEVSLLSPGRGESERGVRQPATGLLDEQVIQLMGFVPEAERESDCSLADVLVITSRLDGLGLAAAEAMAVRHARGCEPGGSAARGREPRGDRATVRS